MRRSTLGGLEVSVVGLGCNNFGRGLDARGARAVVGAALDAGVTLFDTADGYGRGRSERYLASALGDRRNDVVIATKFGLPVHGVPGSGGGRPEYVAAAADRSLRQLDRDWIDLYQLHQPDPLVPIAETLGALGQLVDAGKVRAVGCSDFSPAQLAAAGDLARAQGLPPLASVQVEYSVVNRAPEHSGLAALCAREGVTVIPYRPLAKGLLAGTMQRGDEPVGQLREGRYERFLTEANFAAVERLRALAAERGRSLPAAALAWLLSRPAVAAVCPGATRPDQVRANAAAADWETTPEEVAALEAAAGPPAGGASTGRG